MTVICIKNRRIFKRKFAIVIPNYNNADWIRKCLDSVVQQDYDDYEVVVVDDMSEDASNKIIAAYSNLYRKVIHLLNTEKKFNGGTRNVGLNYIMSYMYCDYVVFLDSDDWFNDNHCLSKIAETIEKNGYPDCVSLSYNCRINGINYPQILSRNNRQELVSSLYVACWTKVIKVDKITLFPENTLMEDVVQHIAQCDKLETVVSIEEPIVVWNRDNINSCSKVENQNLQQGKWQSSMYRYAADLMDLKCNTDECEEHRKWRLDVVLNNIKDGKYIQ